jgi:hypothetical protein
MKKKRATPVALIILYSVMPLIASCEDARFVSPTGEVKIPASVPDVFGHGYRPAALSSGSTTSRTIRSFTPSSLAAEALTSVPLGLTPFAVSLAFAADAAKTPAPASSAAAAMIVVLVMDISYQRIHR